MFKALRTWIILALAVGLVTITAAPEAQSPSPGIGIVIMHGKGGSWAISQPYWWATAPYA